MRRMMAARVRKSLIDSSASRAVGVISIWYAIAASDNDIPSVQFSVHIVNAHDPESHYCSKPGFMNYLMVGRQH